MQERKRAAVVNISSAAGLVGAAGLAVYSASKWSVFGVTEALRAEAVAKGHRGIHFASVHPMFLKTGMFEGARLGGFGRFFFPNVKDHDVVARAIVHFALLRGRRVVKRPRSLRLVLLLRGILPDRWFAALGRAMNLQGSMAGWKGHDKS
jgi:short-subunit dehydrogenase